TTSVRAGSLQKRLNGKSQIGVSGSCIFSFLHSNAVKALPGNSSEFSVIAVEGSNKPVNIVPIEVTSGFWLNQAFKDNTKAQALISACMQEALQRRCDAVFKVAKTEQQYEAQASINRESWEQTRQYLRESHNAFTLACSRWKFNAAQAHDSVTLAVCGKKASELRELDVIEGAPDIGLNHIENLEAMNKIAKVKNNFARYKKGNVRERIIRALFDAIKQ
ncbi:MAG: hypothetical protein RM049_07355, partial [Nostoc sp. DedQUE04]|uniref:hypothetical protein n=1 Tax=Nostoc sp. DedQUE04 TaxID=3075390 RepID=UPI002AD1F7CE